MRSECSIVGTDDTKLVYRQYATLFFVFAVDSSESELGILDLIQVGGQGAMPSAESGYLPLAFADRCQPDSPTLTAPFSSTGVCGDA